MGQATRRVGKRPPGRQAFPHSLAASPDYRRNLPRGEWDPVKVRSQGGSDHERIRRATGGDAAATAGVRAQPRPRPRPRRRPRPGHGRARPARAGPVHPGDQPAGLAVHDPAQPILPHPAQQARGAGDQRGRGDRRGMSRHCPAGGVDRGSGVPPGFRAARLGSSRGARAGRGARARLRGGGRDLRLRGRDGEEPAPPCPRTPEAPAPGRGQDAAPPRARRARAPPWRLPWNGRRTSR